MSKIEKAFENGKAFIGFVTAGDPDMNTSREVILQMARGGCDLIEIGIPFSDPIAEGPVIQEADLRSLSAGTTTDQVMDLAAGISKEISTPLVFMTYLNVLFKYGYDKFLKKVKELLNKKSSIVIAVSEGIKLADGRYVCELGNVGDYVDAFGHKQLQGTATYLANFLAAECGCKTRAVELSTLQRSASHMASRVDIDEAFMVGGAAVKAADEGDTGKMVVIDRVSDDPYMSATGIYDVHRIANEEKLVPRSWMNKEANNVTKDFVDYIKPLIQGDYPPIMVNGMPRHLVLKTKRK